MLLLFILFCFIFQWVNLLRYLSVFIMLSISDVLLIKVRCENDIYFSLWVCLAPLLLWSVFDAWNHEVDRMSDRCFDIIIPFNLSGRKWWLLYRFRRCGKENLFLYQDFTCGFLGILINSYRLFKTLFRCLDYFSYFNMSYAVSCSCNHLCLPFPLTSAHMRILLRASAYFIQVFSCTHNWKEQ